MTTAEQFVLVAAGTASAPSLCFGNTTNNGIYYSNTNAIGLATNGVNRLNIQTNGLIASVRFFAYTGSGGSTSASSPEICFDGDPDCGLYWHGTNDIGLSAGGSERLRVNTSATYSYQSILPITDNASNCGESGRRWALVRGTVITSGDLRFENDWVITEGYNAGLPEDGLILMSPDGRRFRFRIDEVKDGKEAEWKAKIAEKHEHYRTVIDRPDKSAA